MAEKRPPAGKVSETASKEIENELFHDRQMRRHDELWRRERNKIASSSDPYPDFDLGSRGHRNLLSDYDERRTIWEQKRDAMEADFTVKRNDIRETGQTLSDEFTQRSEARNSPTKEFAIAGDQNSNTRSR